MMLGDHIQCISEEISFIGFCLTFSAIIGWITTTWDKDTIYNVVFIINMASIDHKPSQVILSYIPTVRMYKIILLV